MTDKDLVAEAAKECAKEIAGRYPDEMDFGITEIYRCGKLCFTKGVAWAEERSKARVEEITAIANKNADSCQGLSQEIDRLRDQRDALQRRMDVAKEALERIVRFNPSYEYTFENARSISSEALAALSADDGGVSK